MAYFEKGKMKMSSRLEASMTVLTKDVGDKAKEANLGMV
jgi:hypothetical protein